MRKLFAISYLIFAHTIRHSDIAKAIVDEVSVDKKTVFLSLSSYIRIHRYVFISIHRYIAK